MLTNRCCQTLKDLLYILVTARHVDKCCNKDRINCCHLTVTSSGATGSPSQPNAGKRKKLPVDSVFDKFDDEEADEQPRKRKLVPLDYDDDKSLGVDGAGLSNIKGANAEEKRKHIKSLIEKIPTAKPELFSYPLDWSMVDTVRRGEIHYYASVLILPLHLIFLTGFN